MNQRLQWINFAHNVPRRTEYASSEEKLIEKETGVSRKNRLRKPRSKSVNCLESQTDIDVHPYAEFTTRPSNS
ncbi:hypothetical protein [Paraburkholderia sp. DHOC27]|uniref:hypothetical protein n=1 Tax=Paraburkholderia sp. DHOC27 TaxID=2303330 RepID=UPI0011C0D814|nr:hypothetical protein [Paraburkholderia sp. DHOC27]